jgi:hypothetical protein
LYFVQEDFGCLWDHNTVTKKVVSVFIAFFITLTFTLRYDGV